MVSIIDATRDEVLRLNVHKVGLLGTIFTMTGDFFKIPFLDKGIEIIIPSVEEMEFINPKISSELELGIIKKETLEGIEMIAE